jgi:hypothetical protein
MYASASGVPSGAGVAVADSLLAMRFPALAADPSSVDDFSGTTGGRVSLTALAVYLDFDAMEGLRDGQWGRRIAGAC